MQPKPDPEWLGSPRLPSPAYSHELCLLPPPQQREPLRLADEPPKLDCVGGRETAQCRIVLRPGEAREGMDWGGTCLAQGPVKPTLSAVMPDGIPSAPPAPDSAPPATASAAAAFHSLSSSGDSPSSPRSSVSCRRACRRATKGSPECAAAAVASAASVMPWLSRICSGGWGLRPALVDLPSPAQALTFSNVASIARVRMRSISASACCTRASLPTPALAASPPASAAAAAARASSSRMSSPRRRSVAAAARSTISSAAEARSAIRRA